MTCIAQPLSVVENHWHGLTGVSSKLGLCSCLLCNLTVITPHTYWMVSDDISPHSSSAGRNFLMDNESVSLSTMSCRRRASFLPGARWQVIILMSLKLKLSLRIYVLLCDCVFLWFIYFKVASIITPSWGLKRVMCCVKSVLLRVTESRFGGLPEGWIYIPERLPLPPHHSLVKAKGL